MAIQSTMQRILVVEDEASLLDPLRDRLIIEGFDVLEAKDGERGLAIALHNHPDLILLDIIMPKMNGMTMLRKLRRDKWGKTARVIILTNLSGIGRIADAMESKVSEYVIKADIKLGDLVNKIKERFAKAGD